MAENNKVIGNGPVIGNVSKKVNLNIKTGSVTTDKIAAKAVTMDKLGDDTKQHLIEIADIAVKKAVLEDDSIFNISKYNATGDILKAYASLSDALDDVPDSKKEGGLNIMYKDSNNGLYMQYRLRSSTWSKALTLWLEVGPPDKITYVVASSLPVASGSTMYKIYLVPSADPQAQNVKDEYITIYDSDNVEYFWEQIGSTAIDLSGYYTSGQTDSAISRALNTALANYYTSGELDITLANKADKDELPTIMDASGEHHKGGLVPDTPAIAGTTKFLREDATWQEVDLDSKADKATTLAGYGIIDAYTKSELDNLIATQYVAVEATSQTIAVTDVLPATGSTDTIYRVGYWNGSQYDVSCYSEYAWNGSSYVLLSVKTQVGEVFDISIYRASGNILATFDDLSAALNSGNNVPVSVRKGGMSVKFIQNIYATYTVVKTEGLDTEPTGTELQSAPTVIDGVYTASQLSDLNTAATLPATVGSSVTYYFAVSTTETVEEEEVTTTTYTKWGVKKLTDDSGEYVQWRYMGTSIADTDFVNVEQWQKIGGIPELTDMSEYKTITPDWAFPKRKIGVDGSISTLDGVSTSAPILLKAGQVIRGTFGGMTSSAYTPVVLSLTDVSSSAYTPVVNMTYFGGQAFLYVAASDCYVAITRKNDLSIIVEISNIYGASYVSQNYKGVITNVGSSIEDISSFVNRYKVVVNWDRIENKAYRANNTIINNVGYTYIKDVGNIKHICGYVLGNANNYGLLFFDINGRIIYSISRKESSQFYVDMDVPSEVVSFGVWNESAIPPVIIAQIKERLALDNLNELYDTFIHRGYKELSNDDMRMYRGYIAYSTQKIVYGGDIGMVAVGKIGDITEIAFVSMGRTNYSPLAFFDKDFNALQIEQTHSGTKDIISGIPDGAVYFAVSSAQITPFKVYVRETVNKYNSFVDSVDKKRPQNIVGNPYQLVAPQEEIRQYMKDAAITSATTTKYVNPSTGSDTNSGTQASPVKTITKALELAQGSDCNIYLNDGTYRIAESLTIANTGKNTKLYSPTGNAVIKGSVLLSSPTDEGNGVISFSYSGGEILHEIFVNDCVRFPSSAGNDVPGDLVEATYISYAGTNLSNGYQEFKIKMGESDVAKLANYVDVGFVTFYRDWRSIVGVIKGVDTTNNTISIYVAPSFKTGTVEGVYGGVQKIVIKNINETLDCYTVDSVVQPSLREGSFFYDIPNNKLYYKLKEGESIENITVEVPLHVNITVNSPCVFNSIKFSQFGGTLFNSTYYTGACSDHQGGYCMDGVFKVYSANTLFYKCEFTGFTLHCIKFYNGATDGSVVDCYFHENGCGAVMIGERDKDAVNVPTGIDVHHNVTKMSGQCLPESCAFIMTFAEDCEFSDNTIAYSSYSGFNIGYVWYRDTAPTGLKNCAIKRNDISYVGHPWSNDLGAIYTLGDTQGLKIYGNYIHDIYSINANRNGIYLDEGTKNTYVYNNVVMMNNNHSHLNRLNYIYNNVFSGAYYINNTTIDVTLYGNIFVAAGDGYTSVGSVKRIDVAQYAQANVCRNLYWGDGCDTVTAGAETNPYIADPNFTNLSKGNFVVYDTENIEKIGFQSFTLTAGAKGCNGERDVFEWYSY